MRVLIAAAALAAAPTLAAAQSFPAAPPIDAPKPFRMPAAETYTLRNGVKVTLIPYGVAPKTIVRLRIEAGAVDAGDDALLNQLAAEMLKEGAAGKTGAQLARAAADMGGDLSVGSGDRSSNVSINVLSERAPDAIALVADVALRPTWPDDAFARVKANDLRSLSVALSQPGPVADYALNRALYPGHPYGAIPDPAKVAGYTLAQARAFHDANFGAARAHVYVAGRFDAAAVKAAIARAFGDWASGNARRLPDAVQKPGPQVILVDRPGAPQSTLRLSFPVPLKGDPGEATLEVTDALLGGAFSSRITRNIRENKGYTYSPYSYLDFYPDTARWIQNADVTSTVTGASLHEIWAEIAALKAAPATEAEASGIKTYEAGIFTLRGSTPGGVASLLAERDALGLPGDWLDRYVPRILAVSSADVSATARARFTVPTQTLVVVGDLKTVVPQLRAQPELRGATFQTVTVP